MIKIKQGLDLPIGGMPSQSIEDAKPVASVAILGEDYIGMKPTMAVTEGDKVKLGQELFACKKTPGLIYTAPASGTVSAVNRGAKRALLSVVIDVDHDSDEAVEFASYSEDQVRALERQPVVDNLVASGLWTALRTRPFSRVPAIDTTPAAIFVTAMDSSPGAPDASVVLNEYASDFALGLDILAKLTEGSVFVCHEDGKFLPNGTDSKLKTESFSGVHPSGLAGTHIHFLSPVGIAKSVWTIGYQDVIAVGRLFVTGRLFTERVVSLSGPSVSNPRLLRTRLGACLQQLTNGELSDESSRVISGSVLAGRTASSPVCYLGRYHSQVSALPDEADRQLFGYLNPGVKQHSVFPTFLSKWFGSKELPFSTNKNGSTRAMVPIGTYESVVPMDMLPTQLLRALLVGDLETATALGALELDEEDLALCTYVCPGKYEYGPVLRTVLNQIEKEG
ncbi:MAG: Na(+)-translocating NADH-quinone reductase subunit A [Pseudomonadaceae bacterium]|nr:Na(+)-translocating NADH-quinone reductase subunit A [Pseudomonadaceae bacterium]